MPPRSTSIPKQLAKVGDVPLQKRVLQPIKTLIKSFKPPPPIVYHPYFPTPHFKLYFLSLFSLTPLFPPLLLPLLNSTANSLILPLPSQVLNSPSRPTLTNQLDLSSLSILPHPHFSFCHHFLQLAPSHFLYFTFSHFSHFP